MFDQQFTDWYPMNNSAAEYPINALLRDFIATIHLDASDDEVSNIAGLVIENVFDLPRAALFTDKKISVSAEQWSQLDVILKRVNSFEPIQYILGQAWFFNRQFLVNPAVLIPRPETEELVAMIAGYFRNATPRILDIGTGSGCIPITLALEIPSSEIIATDISESALEVAKENARLLGASVDFTAHNILTEQLPWQSLDCIVSNPPYIAFRERTSMNENVTAYEPHLALFVPDEDPYVFYQNITTKAVHALKHHGLLAVEINENGGSVVARLFVDSGFGNVQIKKDISGKDRIVTGVLI